MYIFHSGLQDLRRKAARLVAAKCTLASRVDSFHESSDGKVTVQMEHMHINAEFIMSCTSRLNIFLTQFTYM